MPREADFEGYDEAVVDFLSTHKTGTKHTYKSLLKHFLNFTGMTGQQILASKRSAKNFEWEKKVIKFKQWMKTQKNRNGTYYSDNAVSTAVHAVRSFFDHHHLPLEFNHSEARKLSGRAQRVTRDYVLSNPVIGKMAFVGGLREKYIVLLGKSLGLRASDFVTLTYGTFRSIDLDQEPPISLGEIQTIKEKITAHPFIDADALPIVKQVLDSNRDKPNDERIITVKPAELSSIIQALAKEANIDLGGKHLRFHCFRKYLIDRLATSTSSESKWKQIIGKAVSEDAYVSTFDLRKCYLQTMELTTLEPKETGKVTKLDKQVTAVNVKVLELNSKFSEEITQLRSQMGAKDGEIQELKHELKCQQAQHEKRLGQIEGILFPTTKVTKIEDIEAYLKEREEWEKKHPEEARKQDELSEQFQKYVDDKFAFFDWLRKNHPARYRLYLENEVVTLQYQTESIAALIKKDKGSKQQNPQQKEKTRK